MVNQWVSPLPRDTMFGDDSDGDGDDSDSEGVEEDVRNSDTPVTDLTEGGFEEDETDSGSEDLQRLVATLQSVVDSESVCSCVGCRWCVCVPCDHSGYSGEKDPKSPLEAWSSEDRLEPLDESTIEEDEEWQDSGQLWVWMWGVWVCGYVFGFWLCVGMFTCMCVHVNIYVCRQASIQACECVCVCGICAHSACPCTYTCKCILCMCITIVVVCMLYCSSHTTEFITCVSLTLFR